MRFARSASIPSPCLCVSVSLCLCVSVSLCLCVSVVKLVFCGRCKGRDGWCLIRPHPNNIARRVVLADPHLSVSVDCDAAAHGTRRAPDHLRGMSADADATVGVGIMVAHLRHAGLHRLGWRDRSAGDQEQVFAVRVIRLAGECVCRDQMLGPTPGLLAWLANALDHTSGGDPTCLRAALAASSNSRVLNDGGDWPCAEATVSGRATADPSVPGRGARRAFIARSFGGFHPREACRRSRRQSGETVGAGRSVRDAGAVSS
jgi:hypothetical protein